MGPGARGTPVAGAPDGAVGAAAWTGSGSAKWQARLWYFYARETIPLGLGWFGLSLLQLFAEQSVSSFCFLSNFRAHCDDTKFSSMYALD